MDKASAEMTRHRKEKEQQARQGSDLDMRKEQDRYKDHGQNELLETAVSEDTDVEFEQDCYEL